jgi:hypothetical protein
VEVFFGLVAGAIGIIPEIPHIEKPFQRNELGMAIAKVSADAGPSVIVPRIGPVIEIIVWSGVRQA